MISCSYDSSEENYFDLLYKRKNCLHRIYRVMLYYIIIIYSFLQLIYVYCNIYYITPSQSQLHLQGICRTLLGPLYFTLALGETLIVICLSLLLLPRFLLLISFTQATQLCISISISVFFTFSSPLAL